VPGRFGISGPSPSSVVEHSREGFAATRDGKFALGDREHLSVTDLNQNYVVSRRAGMSIELVPMLVGNTHRPTGQRGYFAWSRIGGGSVVDAAGRLLNQT
jgi:hypothetical protein